MSEKKYKIDIYFPDVRKTIVCELSQKAIDSYTDFYNKIRKEFEESYPDEVNDSKSWHDFLRCAFMEEDDYMTVSFGGCQEQAHVEYVDLENPIWT